MKATAILNYVEQLMPQEVRHGGARPALGAERRPREDLQKSAGQSVSRLLETGG